MKKLFIIIPVIIALIASIFFLFLGDDDIESAIDEFEDKNYVNAIEMLNHLIPVSDFETSEKIYYYRTRAINRLADQFEEDLDDELKITALENKSNPEFDETKKELIEEINDVNERIVGDSLKLVITRKKSRILTKGLFYNDFVSKYRGSSLIEDLDFEEIQQIAKTDTKQYFNYLINFYNKFPNTSYIGQIVGALFDGLQNSTIRFTKERKDVFWSIITTYVHRHPTSPVMSKLYNSTGDNVNLRDSPGLQGKRVGKIKMGEILIQLEKSMDSSQVGDVRDHWYRVSSLDGTTGWIFGKFLTSIDVSKIKVEETEIKWGIDEHFNDWLDSNTPKNWMHIDNANKETISFKAQKDKKIVELNSPSGKWSGLYSRYGSSKAFTVLIKARYVEGDDVTLVSYSLGSSSVFSLNLSDGNVVVSGRKIPVHTTDWHEYHLESNDGKFATLKIDGQIISSRIEPVSNKAFPNRGIYCLYSSDKNKVKAFIEYIKVR